MKGVVWGGGWESSAVALSALWLLVTGHCDCLRVTGCYRPQADGSRSCGPVVTGRGCTLVRAAPARDPASAASAALRQQPFFGFINFWHLFCANYEYGLTNDYLSSGEFLDVLTPI